MTDQEFSPAPTSSMADLAAQFCSLGGGVCVPSPLGFGCEFGFFRRRAGAEPIDLMRWASISPNNLIRALRGRFEGLDDPSELEMRERQGGSDYAAFHAGYGIFMAHTGIDRQNISASAAAERYAQTLRFLRRKTLEDLSEGRRIFVYRAADNPMSAKQHLEISSAVSGYGAGIVLCVEVSPQPFKVSQSLPNLLIGTIDRFANPHNNAEHNDAGWERICKATLRFIASSGGQELSSADRAK